MKKKKTIIQEVQQSNCFATLLLDYLVLITDPGGWGLFHHECPKGGDRVAQ